MSDFNGDGFDDLVVGAPGESPGDDLQSGAIFTLRGTPNGLTGNRGLDQEILGVGTNEEGDLFGVALAVGDFNNDGYDDVVVGASGESPGDEPRSGAIFTLRGTPNGLVGDDDFDQENLGVGSNDINDFFGEALAVGDFNNDGFDDVVVGAPGESPGDDPQSGAIFTLRGTPNGLVGDDDFDQENLGVGSNEFADSFGEALAVGDFNNDGFDDVVVGAPGESPGDDPQSGAIYILNGSSNGLVAGIDFDQENLDIGTNEFNDSFGEALSVLDFNADGFDDLVVGAPGESPGDEPQSGAIYTLRGTPNGLVEDNDFDQEDLGVGQNDLGDLFGATLASSRSEDEPIVNPDPLPEGQVGLYRFRNTNFDTGAYLFVGESEKNSILSNPDLNRTFTLEGNGNRAFVASSIQSNNNLIPIYRLRNVDITGTYLFVGIEEYITIFAEDSNQRNKWIKEGLNADGGDIADFYVFGAGTNQGTAFNRFQNQENGTYLFAAPAETEAIRNDPNLSNVFLDQGVAFESL